jgi:hypothetical protein
MLALQAMAVTTAQVSILDVYLLVELKFGERIRKASLTGKLQAEDIYDHR